MILSKIKTYALAALGVIAAIFSALFYREKAKHEQAVRKGVEQARETEKKDSKATREGLQNEANVLNNDSVDADHFN